MKPIFIFNPSSGRARNPAAALAELRAAVERWFPGSPVEVTARPGHAEELSRRAQADGCGLVVAVGGDGTANEVARPLIGGKAVFGLVPRGSGNGLARHLGFPLRISAAVAALASGSDRVIDTGLANGRPFLNVAGIGLDADVAERMAALSRRGAWPYFKISAAAAWNGRPFACGMSGEDWEKTQKVWLVAVANSDQWGNNARVAPGARVDDGLLDLVAVGAVSRWRAPALALRLFAGGFDRHPRVFHRRGGSFRISRSGGGVFHTDGEVWPGSSEWVVQSVPRSLRVRAPAGNPSVVTRW